jgi:hypothetical protein
MIYEEIAKIFKNHHSPLTIVEDELFYNGKNYIPEHCVDLAKEYKTRLIDYLNGVDMAEQIKRDDLFIKVMYFYRNIADTSNDHIEKWLEHDKEAALIFMKLTTAYEEKGWDDISVAPFNFSSGESERLQKELYENAITHFRKGTML